MSQWTDMYKQKLMTPEEAVKVVKSGDWVDYGMGTTSRTSSTRPWQPDGMNCKMSRSARVFP